MPEFVLLCRDKKDGLDLRLATRDAHLAYVGNAKIEILLAGPILDGGDNPAGSLFIINAENEPAVRVFTENDPYSKAGLFESADIWPYRMVAGKLMAQ